MDIKLFPGKLSGTVAAIPSKSQAHRLLICAALADAPTALYCPQTNRDIEATAACLQALGAGITYSHGTYLVEPIRCVPQKATLPCGESGSTLRFLLPLAGALGVDATFCLEGRLGQRPLSPLWEEMVRMGCCLSRPTADTVRCTGQLQSGDFHIPGNISSQFITGLLFACSKLPQGGSIHIAGKLESLPYVNMTREAMAIFGAMASGLEIPPLTYRSPGKLEVEGDWSNAAFFLAANALGSQVCVTGLRPESAQGDRVCTRLLASLQGGPSVIDATDIPDLVPILCVAAACCHGAEFTGIHRLRLKESDRVATVVAMLQSLGAEAAATQNTIRVTGGGLRGGTVDAAGDHRIAMSAAIAATACKEPVVILGAQCASKSYPGFWDTLRSLGGNYEQYLR